MQGIAQAWRRAALALLLCLPFVPAIAAQDAPPGISVADLPEEARVTLHLILHDGPFPYARDGIVFGNHEHRLPEQPYACTMSAAKPEACESRCEASASQTCSARYREYTVKTPGVKNRGPRRIVCDEMLDCYYTADHYRSFRHILEQQ